MDDSWFDINSVCRSWIRLRFLSARQDRKIFSGIAMMIRRPNIQAATMPRVSKKASRDDNLSSVADLICRNIVQSEMVCLLS